MNDRSLSLTLATALALALSFSASAQDKGGAGGSDPGDEVIIVTGGTGTRPPGGTPEPFTLALGAGAVGLYARRKMKSAAKR